MCEPYKSSLQTGLKQSLRMDIETLAPPLCCLSHALLEQQGLVAALAVHSPCESSFYQNFLELLFLIMRYLCYGVMEIV